MLLAAYAAVTSPNGSKGASKADWTPLRDRRVVIWPDADAVGLEYARSVAKHVFAAGAVSVAIASPPDGSAVGWDAADALAEGWNGERAGKLVAAAEPFKWKPATAKGDGEDDATAGDHPGGGRRRVPQRDMLIGLTEFVELWHDANRIAYATFPVNDHRENWPVRSRDFRMWLSGQFYEKTGTAIGGQALEDGVRILEARAVNEGPQHEVFIRTGYTSGKMYLDLGDATWRAIEITSTGWCLIEKPPLKFLRSPSMRPLPAPEPGSLIEELRHFINVKTTPTSCWWWPGSSPRCATGDRFRSWSSTARPAPASRCSRASSGLWSIRAQHRSAPCRATIATLWCRLATLGCSLSTTFRTYPAGSPMRCVGSQPEVASRRACCTPTATR